MKNLNELPYKEIGGFPDSFSAGNILKRLIDGLGYRYYWATDSLNTHDLQFKASPEARTSLETLEHILDLTDFVLRIVQGKYNTSFPEKEKLDFESLREHTLLELKTISQLLGQMTDDEFKSLEILIQRNDQRFSIPLWNLLNGPISDAIHHVGQIVLLRRASGNPINPKVDIFTGKNRP